MPKVKNYVRVKNLCVRQNLRVRKKIGKTKAPRKGEKGGGPIHWPRTNRHSTTLLPTKHFEGLGDEVGVVAPEVVEEDRYATRSAEGQIALVVGGTAKLASDMVMVPNLITIFTEEWLIADVAGGRDSEAHLAVDGSPDPHLVEVDRERLLLQVEHLLDEPLHTVLNHINLLIALEFGDD